MVDSETDQKFLFKTRGETKKKELTAISRGGLHVADIEACEAEEEHFLLCSAVYQALDAWTLKNE